MVLPILLLLTLIALDFGRVYLGYINLQNMARIAANFAANNSSAWDATPIAADQAKYKNQILADATAINCALPKVAGVTMVPTPTFTDANGNGKADLGEMTEVQITCTFGVITPGISNIVGGTVKVSAASRFPVKSGLTSTGPGGGGGSAPNAAFSGNGVISPNSISGVAPFAVEFRDTSGGSPTWWAWTFPDPPASTSTAQDPLLHVFTVPGTYVVSMTASNILGSSPASMGVTVLASSTVDFTRSPAGSVTPGTSVTFTDTSTVGGTAWAWTFGAGQGTATGAGPVSHTYNLAGTYTVSLTVTYPGPIGPITNTKVGFVTVAVGSCTVPQLVGKKVNVAQAFYSGAPYNFTGIVIKAAGAPSGNFTITAQSLVYGGTPPATAPCNSDITVSAP